MDDKQKIFMSAERAIKRLAKLARQIDSEHLADWLVEGDKLGECDAGDVWFVAEWLTDVVHGPLREFEQAKSKLSCAVCGEIYWRQQEQRLQRRNARYCSNKCRQKAYRLRYTSPAKSK